MKLSIGNYGLQSLEPDRAVAVIREIGYDGAELCLMSGWPTEPVRLDAAARRRLREQPLPIPTMLENFSLLVSNADHARILDRIRAAAVLAHDAAHAGVVPMLQSVLGGRPGEWEQVKSHMASRLAEWAAVAGRNGLKLAVKSHYGSAADDAEKLVWLLDQVRSPALSGIYDYSHFQLAGLGLKETLDTLLPRSSFITVKDGRMADGRNQYLLPGDGTVDYGAYMRLLRERGYRGWMLVEVSRQLQTAPGYDGLAAARRSYAFMSRVLRESGLR